MPANSEDASTPANPEDANTPATRGPRLVLAVGIVAGLCNAVLFPLSQPEQVGIATDVYTLAARTALNGGDFYAVSPPAHPQFGFRYPPILVVAFLGHGLLGPDGAFGLQTALNLATAGALALLLVRLTECGVELTWRDRALIAGFVFTSAASVSNLVMGQVNHQLALAIAAGALLLERERAGAAGIAFGLAATGKLFPALLGAWLLARRAWRAIAAATATGLALLAVGLIVFGPSLTVTYVTETLTAEASVGSFASGPDATAPYLTIRRQLSVLLPWLGVPWRTAVGALALGCVVLAANRSHATLTRRLVGLEATLLATLILFPLEPFYLLLALCPTLPLVYLLDPGRPRRLFLAGVLMVSLPVTYEGLLSGVKTVGLSEGIGSALRSIAQPAFQFALPAMYGVWLVLAACVLVQYRESADDSGRDTTAQGRGSR